MASALIGVHAALGEIGSILFLWVFIEILNSTEKSINRAKKAALIGSILFLLSWVIGGYYYLTIYGPNVKPLIKESSISWAHSIVMETKEHVFLLLPLLSTLIYFIIKNNSKEIIKDKKLRTSILILSLLTFMIGMSMAFLGYLISSATRLALEAKVL